MLELKINNKTKGPRILVIGVGGGGNNALDRMVSSNISGVEYVAVNTDSQVLDVCKANEKIQIGTKSTGGYGAGADPDVGEAAALENEDEIRAIINEADMCIITCGMGGGTGTGATPIIAKICKEMGILTVGVVTTPFSFESTPRVMAAQNGVDKLKANVDTLLVIPNDKLIYMSEKPLLLDDAFSMADSVLKYTIEGITNIINNRGTINIDFNDLKTTLRDKGIGHLGIGTVAVDGSILEAVEQAVNSPLLETTIQGAENLLVNTSGKVNIVALNEAINHVRELAGTNVNIIWGTVSADNFDEDKIVVTLIATGMKECDKETQLVQNIKAINRQDYPQDRTNVNRNVAQREFISNGLVRRNGTENMRTAGTDMTSSSVNNRNTEKRIVGSGVEELELEIPTFLMNACRRNKGINKK